MKIARMTARWRSIGVATFVALTWWLARGRGPVAEWLQAYARVFFPH